MKKILWRWKFFWGNQYRIYDKNNKAINKILIYHRKIYILD